MKTLRLLARCALAASLAGGLLLTALLLFTARGQALLTQARERSPNEGVRYLQRRLQGHPKLEAVLLPPLAVLQSRLEREPAGEEPAHAGAGQRPEPVPADPGLTRTWRVDSPQAIRQALAEATPGTAIVVAPGLYPFDLNLRLGQDGRAGAPIALRAERPGTVWFEFAQLEGVLVDRPHWRFENLGIRGTCAQHADCEHAFHVVGRGRHVVIRNNHISEFNAHIKVNGLGSDWPDHGLLEANTLTNRLARETDRPVALLDLVGAHHWRVQDNRVSHFVKAQGNRVAYGLFAKGASEGARFERNLVICTPSGISRPGERVGLSFGGGGTGPSSCRDGSCQAFEHRHGLAAHNTIAHCNDVGIDANHAVEITLTGNTLINTAGIGARRGAHLRLSGNANDGGLWVRDGSQVDRLGE